MVRGNPAKKNADKSAEKPEKKVVKKVVRRKKVAKEATPEPAPEEETPIVEEVVTPGGSRKRREVTVESVDSDFDSVIKALDDELNRQREAKEANGGKTPQGAGVKFIRSLAKSVKQLQSDTRRISKKKRQTRAGNSNSGFNKEVEITDEFAKFCGVKPGTLMCRTAGTRKIQAYITEKGLQNKEYRREILPDETLTKLLGYNAKNEKTEKNPEGKLFYFTVQKLMQKHFKKASAEKTA